MVDYKDEIIQAVNKDLQKERWLSFWKKYHTAIIIGALLVVGGVSSLGWWFYDSSVTRYNASRMLLTYLPNLEDSNSKDLVVVEDLLESPESLWPIQSLNYVSELARKYMDEDQAHKAIEVLNKYQPTGNKFFDEFIELQKGQAYLLSKDYDKAFEILNPLSKHSTSWQYIALEWLAELSFQSDDLATARSYLKAISDDPQAPQALRERSSRMLKIL